MHMSSARKELQLCAFEPIVWWRRRGLNLTSRFVLADTEKFQIATKKPSNRQAWHDISVENMHFLFQGQRTSASVVLELANKLCFNEELCLASTPLFSLSREYM